MTVDDLNRLPDGDAVSEFLRCCSSSRWAKLMTEGRPFQSKEDVLTASDSICGVLSPSDWQEAFAHHPKIGDTGAPRKKLESTKQWSEGEQALVRHASEKTLKDLADGNRKYETRFGYSFIVCATGKNAEEMLALLTQRLSNDASEELTVASQEQQKITQLRLEKLLSEG